MVQVHPDKVDGRDNPELNEGENIGCMRLNTK